jgi:hypothetical protein
MLLHVLYVSAYCGHYQLRRACKSSFFLSAIPPYTDQYLHIARALYGYVVYVVPLQYKMYYILNVKIYIFKNIKIFKLELNLNYVLKSIYRYI